MTAEFKNSNESPQVKCQFNMIVTSNSRLTVYLEGDADAWRRRLAILRYERKKPEIPIPNIAEKIVAEGRFRSPEFHVGRLGNASRHYEKRDKSKGRLPLSKIGREAPIQSNRSPANMIVEVNSKTMKKNLRTLAVPASVAAGFIIGCASAPRVVERTDPARPSIVQVQEGFDTVGRKWEVQITQPVPVSPEPVAVAVGAAPQAEVLSRTEAMARNFVGTITDIDYPNRKMTLRAADGRTETFAVDKEIRRFNEAKVGDKVSMDYYLGVTAEVRKPTPDELQNPLVVLDSESKTGLDQAPAGHTTRRIRAVVTIEGMDRSAQTVTVIGPRGNRFTTRVDDPSKLEQVHIGDTILMTFTEATGVSLKPVD